MSLSSRQKIIIDTDCGIDDAIALLLALSSKDVSELLAITCCFGNTSLDNVCSNVMRVLTVCGETSIPIHRGCSEPLIKSRKIDNPAYEKESKVHGDDGLGNCAHEFSTGELKESDIPASLAMINLAKKYPKEITLIAVGPLTNLAITHRIDPTFTENLKSIVIMGGNYKALGNVTEYAEFNFYCDPESANIVLSEAKCSVVIVPWETTMAYGIPWDLYNELLKINTPKSHFFKRITAMKYRNRRARHQLFDCDCLAVIAALYPDSVDFSFRRHLCVEHEGGITTGLMILLTHYPITEYGKEPKIIKKFKTDFLYSLRSKMLL